jgi:hypothetical protein
MSFPVLLWLFVGLLVFLVIRRVLRWFAVQYPLRRLHALPTVPLRHVGPLLPSARVASASPRGRAAPSTASASASLDDLLFLSATQLAARIKKRELTSLQLVELFITYTKKVNPYINAAVAYRFDEARAEALAADRLVASTKNVANLPVFHGVPCSVKEVRLQVGNCVTSHS